MYMYEWYPNAHIFSYYEIRQHIVTKGHMEDTCTCIVAELFWWLSG